MTLSNTPLIKQGWLRAVMLMLAFLACSVLAGFITGFFPVSAGTSNATTILSLFILQITGILLTVLFRRIIDLRTVMSMGFRWRQHEHDGYTGFCLGPALLGAGTLVLFGADKLEWGNVTFPASDVFIALVLMAMVALSEEMVFRGYILNNLMQSVNKWPALGISAGLFALAHGSNPGITIVAGVNLVLAGLLLGINYIYTRNLWFAILFHFSWNFFQGPVLGYSVSGLPLQSILQPQVNGPGWITGGAFGFEGSFITTCLFTIALLTFYAVYEKRGTLNAKPGTPNAKR